jgi:histidine triad (HIT) family protein
MIPVVMCDNDSRDVVWHHEAWRKVAQVNDQRFAVLLENHRGMLKARDLHGFILHPQASTLKGMEPSIFTRIINREIPAFIVYEDESVIAFLDVTPVAPGHTLVVPKQQVENLWDLDDETYQHVMAVAKRFANHMTEKLGPQKVGEMVEGFGVPHAHVHLIPLDAGYEETLSAHWANKQPLDPASGEKMQEILQLDV